MLKYAVHAYSWVTSWSNESLYLIDHCKELGLDLIEIPLMEIRGVDPESIRKRLDEIGLGVVTSTVLKEETDITSDEPVVRKRGVEYLKECVEKTAEMGGEVFSGVIYSAIGRKLSGKPEKKHWEWSAEALKEVAQYAQKFNLRLGLEPVNRYETFLINTAEQALQLIEMIGESNVGVHLDAYHMNIEENDFYEATKKVCHLLCHYHLSESHRGIPGTGTVDWEGIYRALGECNYQGVVGLESFVEVSDAMREATCIWRELAPNSDELIKRGLEYLKGLERKYYQKVK
ncbi:sugar phosphate isomerase/epimerase [Candidatus Sumerlaeota bacterium]|nr:sugar phosphate isomerase/epimerase [Candidatus Sumerlaeota bacterium]